MAKIYMLVRKMRQCKNMLRVGEIKQIKKNDELGL